jgi:hypothetical protein
LKQKGLDVTLKLLGVFKKQQMAHLGIEFETGVAQGACESLGVFGRGNPVDGAAENEGWRVDVG